MIGNDEQEKQMIGYIFVAIIESMVLVLLQLLTDLGWKPLYILAINIIIAIIGGAMAWFVRHRFGIPQEEPGPIPIPIPSEEEMDVELIIEEAIEGTIEDIEAEIEELKADSEE